MNYKMIYVKLTRDTDYDISSQLLLPVIYDQRYLKTREEIIKKIKQYVTNELNRLCFKDLERDLQNDIFWREVTENCYIYDREALLFNKDNDLRILFSFSYAEEDNNYYLYGRIYETSIPEIKEQESDLEGDYLNTVKNEYSNIFDDNFHIKRYIFCSEYTIYPHYDMDERYEYCGGFKNISKNLLALFLKEREDFYRQYCHFYNYCYGNTDGIDDTNKRELNVSVLATNKQFNKNSIVNRCIREYNDGNGLDMSCYIRPVPIVSYISR